MKLLGRNAAEKKIFRDPPGFGSKEEPQLVYVSTGLLSVKGRWEVERTELWPRV